MKLKFGAAMAAATVAGITAMAGSTPAQACGYGAYIGQICMVAGNFCPEGTYNATGTIMAVNQDQALYTLLGTRYGGNQSQSTFGLPNLTLRMPVGTQSTLPIATKRGTSTAQLGSANLPTHTHGATYSPQSATNPLSMTPTVAASQSTGNDKIPNAGDYLAVTIGSGTAQWPHYAAANAAGAMVPLGGVTSPISGTGTPVLTPTGAAAPASPINIIPPQVGMNICIVGTGGGYYPVNPN